MSEQQTLQVPGVTGSLDPVQELLIPRAPTRGVDREMQRRDVYGILKATERWSDEHCLAEAERIVEKCRLAPSGGGA